MMTGAHRTAANFVIDDIICQPPTEDFIISQGNPNSIQAFRKRLKLLGCVNQAKDKMNALDVVVRPLCDQVADGSSKFVLISPSMIKFLGVGLNEDESRHGYCTKVGTVAGVPTYAVPPRHLPDGSSFDPLTRVLVTGTYFKLHNPDILSSFSRNVRVDPSTFDVEVFDRDADRPATVSYIDQLLHNAGLFDDCGTLSAIGTGVVDIACGPGKRVNMWAILDGCDVSGVATQVLFDYVRADTKEYGGTRADAWARLFRSQHLTMPSENGEGAPAADDVLECLPMRKCLRRIPVGDYTRSSALLILSRQYDEQKNMPPEAPDGVFIDGAHFFQFGVSSGVNFFHDFSDAISNLVDRWRENLDVAFLWLVHDSVTPRERPLVVAHVWRLLTLESVLHMSQFTDFVRFVWRFFNLMDEGRGDESEAGEQSFCVSVSLYRCVLGDGTFLPFGETFGPDSAFTEHRYVDTLNRILTAGPTDSLGYDFSVAIEGILPCGHANTPAEVMRWFFYLLYKDASWTDVLLFDKLYPVLMTRYGCLWTFNRVDTPQAIVAMKSRFGHDSVRADTGLLSLRRETDLAQNFFASLKPSREVFFFFLRTGIPCGLSILMFRPAVRQESHTVVVARAGCGQTKVGHANMATGVNVVNKSITAHFTMQIGHAVTEPSGIAMHRDCCIGRQLSGGNLDVFSPDCADDVERIQTLGNYAGSSDDPCKSLFAVAVCSNDPCLSNTKSIVDITGKLPPGFPSSYSEGQYGTSKVYSRFWNWSHDTCVSPDRNYSKKLHYTTDTGNESAYTTLLSQEWTSKSRNGVAHTVAVNEGYWGPRSFAGRAGEYLNNDVVRSAPVGQVSIAHK
jgi:hypothetical protein